MLGSRKDKTNMHRTHMRPLSKSHIWAEFNLYLFNCEFISLSLLHIPHSSRQSFSLISHTSRLLPPHLLTPSRPSSSYECTYLAEKGLMSSLPHAMAIRRGRNVNKNKNVSRHIKNPNSSNWINIKKLHKREWEREEKRSEVARKRERYTFSSSKGTWTKLYTSSRFIESSAWPGK